MFSSGSSSVATLTSPVSLAGWDKGLEHAHGRALAPAQKTAAVTLVRYLERQIFDDDGHRRRHVKEPMLDELVGQINELRHVLGWLEIDLQGKWRWPN
jgi:hypothetical protein